MTERIPIPMRATHFYKDKSCTHDGIRFVCEYPEDYRKRHPEQYEEYNVRSIHIDRRLACQRPNLIAEMFLDTGVIYGSESSRRSVDLAIQIHRLMKQCLTEDRRDMESERRLDFPDFRGKLKDYAGATFHFCPPDVDVCIYVRGPRGGLKEYDSFYLRIPEWVEKDRHASDVTINEADVLPLEREIISQVIASTGIRNGMMQHL